MGDPLSRGRTFSVLEYKTVQSQRNTAVTKRSNSRSERSGSWPSSISAAENSTDVPWPVVVQATTDKANKEADPGEIPVLRTAPSSRRNSESCDDEAKRSAAAGGSFEYLAGEGREGGRGGKGYEDTDESERFEEEDEDGRENRYLMAMPPLMPEITELSPSQSLSTLVKVEEPSAGGEDGYSFDEGFSFQNFGRRENRSGSQLPLGRRASLSIQYQVSIWKHTSVRISAIKRCGHPSSWQLT